MLSMSGSDVSTRARLMPGLPIGRMPRLTVNGRMQIEGVGDERDTHQVRAVGLMLPKAPRFCGLGGQVEH